MFAHVCSSGRLGLALAFLAAGFVYLGGANPAVAQEDPLVSGGRPRRADTLEYITIDVRDKDLREVLQGIGRQVDINIVADPEVNEKVTISLDSIEWRQALSVIARQANCKILFESPRLIRFSQPPAISIEFQDADLKVVLDLLAKQSGANIVIAEDITGKVSLSLRDVPWRDALDTIVKTAGYVTVEESEGVTDIIRVVRAETLKKNLLTRVFRLRHVRPPERYEAIIADVEKQTIDRQGSGKVALEEEFTLLRALKKALSEDGEMDFDVATNTLIVKDVEPRLIEMERLIENVDVEQPLVQVQVRFISTSSDDVLEQGLKFDLPDTPAREGLRIRAFAAEPASNFEQDGISTGSVSLFSSPIEVNGGTFPFDLGRINSFRHGNFEALGVLDFRQTQILLSMVRDDDNSKIIQEPKLTTLDNHPSTIFVGESVPFAVQQVKQDQNGNISVSIDENDRSPINVGFTLYISPHVVPGTDTIHMNVIPKVSSLTGTTSPLDGFDRFSFADPGTANETFIDLPREASQTIVTYLRVESGHTAVIGGLHTERKFEIETRVPVLSSVPVVGNLFRWKRKATTIDHLLILITPRKIATTEVSDEQYEAAIEEAMKYDYFLRKYGESSDKDMDK
ncbi:MAG: secretin N-terminal domain-containing protein [Planctomycetota bacterium]